MNPASGPSGPRARFPGDFAYRIAHDRLAFLRDMAAAGGDVSMVTIGGRRVVLLTNPDDIREVLVGQQRRFVKGTALQRLKSLLGEGVLTSEGEFHLRQRRLLQPAFHRSRIAEYAKQMSAAAAVCRAGWRDGARLNAHDEMMRLTLHIVSATLFSADIDAEASEIGTAVSEAFADFDFGYGPLTFITDRLPSPRRRRFARARARLDETVYRIIRERRLAGTDAGDLLSMLLLARDAEGDGSGMTDQQVRDEALTLFLAGHETTANLLTWTWLLLARNPAQEALLQAELDTVLEGRTPTFDDLAALPYTRNVLNESMRLYPPAYLLGRRSIAPHTVGPWTFPEGTLFLLPTFLVHRDPRWWSDADAFRPERWDTADEARPKFAYFPFGAGTRICIGEQFARTEAALILATLAQRWTLRVPGPDPEPETTITMRPRGGIPIVAQAR
jgi:cytochrome P450